MRGTVWIFAVFLGIFNVAEARQPAETPLPKRWDLAGSVALFDYRPGDNNTLYNDDWYSAGRFGAQIGYYWTEFLKTEVEYSTTTEGTLYFQEFRRTPDQRNSYSQNYEINHRVEQLQLRLTAQFRRNAWVHPYLTGGLIGERDRTRIQADRNVHYLTGQPALVIPEFNNGPHSEYNVGFALGGGAKFYTSQNTFINVGTLGTWSSPTSGSISLLAGFGIDF